MILTGHDSRQAWSSVIVRVNEPVRTALRPRLLARLLSRGEGARDEALTQVLERALC